jgi:hypothetical protein
VPVPRRQGDLPGRYPVLRGVIELHARWLLRARPSLRAQRGDALLLLAGPHAGPHPLPPLPRLRRERGISPFSPLRGSGYPRSGLRWGCGVFRG